MGDRRPAAEGTDPNRASIAASLEATPELLPYLAELLCDIRTLGSHPQLIVELLGPLRLPASARCLELACGKGAVAIELAASLRMRARGVDLFPPFIDAAFDLAAERGVADRCEFAVADLRQELLGEASYDVLVYASVGALGPLDRAVAAMRRTIRTGGYLVIDDGYLREDAQLDHDGFDHYATYAETLSRLTASGDRLVGQVAIPPAYSEADNRRICAAIRRRAGQIAERVPDAHGLLQGYVERQQRECAALARAFVDAVWVLQRR